MREIERIEDWPTFSKWLRGLTEAELHDLVVVLAAWLDKDPTFWVAVESYRDLKRKREEVCDEVGNSRQ